MTSSTSGVADFYFGHISDLHCSDGHLALEPNHRHAPELLVGMENVLSRIEPQLDRLIVTGDLSNYGDRGSLSFARMWLTNRVSLGDGKDSGLGFPATKLRVIPGNHDAWNNDRTGTLANRMQRSIQNYNRELPNHAMPQDGCYYDWIQKGTHGVYLAFLNSCHLADTEKYDGSDRIGIDKIARGKVTIEQTEELLSLHEMGLRGELEDSKGAEIDPESYARSLKILVMHHYLFQPTGDKREKTLELDDRIRVFRNIAYADFDLLVCGHKHVSKSFYTKYGEHFDTRAAHRYAWNCFRFHLGLGAQPDQFTDDNGFILTRKLSNVIQIFLGHLARSTGGVVGTDHLNELFVALNAALDNPDALAQVVSNYTSRTHFAGPAIIGEQEFKELRKMLKRRLNKRAREKLKPICDDILHRVKQLKTREFAQIICGSSSKAFESGKDRSFNLYRATRQNGAWNFSTEEYIWHQEVGAFRGPTTSPPISFPRP